MGGGRWEVNHRPPSTVQPSETTMKRGKPPIYIAHTQVGFEVIVAEQLRQEYEGLRVLGTSAVADKNGLVFFTYTGDVSDLFELRTIEDLFVQVLRQTDLPPVYAGLKMLTEAVSTANFDAALALARTISPGRGGRGKLRFRVIARQANQATYRRIDAQQAVEKGMRAREDHKWQFDELNPLEFWLTMLPNEAILGLRLSDEKMRRHDEKREQLPASLRPSAAAALVWLSRVRPTDVFLDPMCGSGTILIERGEVGRYKQIYGGDIRPEAVEATLANIGPRYKPIEIAEWDARSLPLEDASITNVVVNLPFGRQIGSLEDNRVLYPAFLREMSRVVRPAGRLVALTGDIRNFEHALGRSEFFTELLRFDVEVLGRAARAYLFERK